jgi:hypothetical protein
LPQKNQCNNIQRCNIRTDIVMLTSLTSATLEMNPVMPGLGNMMPGLGNKNPRTECAGKMHRITFWRHEVAGMRAQVRAVIVLLRLSVLQ